MFRGEVAAQIAEDSGPYREIDVLGPSQPTTPQFDGKRQKTGQCSE
jgi:hypothetical protein